VAPADREHLRAWLARFTGDEEVRFALEGCTGWRYVVEELAAAGVEPHLAEPADTAALRGRKRHAKTDKADARHLRVHLMAGDLPESWIPPGHVLEARAVVRLYKDLLDERGGWQQRIAATLFHQGAPLSASVAVAEGLRHQPDRPVRRRPGDRRDRDRRRPPGVPVRQPGSLPGSPGALLHRGPLRTAHARSRARGPSKPLGRFRWLAVVARRFLRPRRPTAAAGRSRV